uniref:Uncharacterized protein n=1 Tax=Tetranychus urticae TaxID=32264 RepID=T1JYH9_TETUR
MSNSSGSVLPDHLKNNVSEDETKPVFIGPVLPRWWKKVDPPQEDFIEGFIGPIQEPPKLLRRRYNDLKSMRKILREKYMDER